MFLIFSNGPVLRVTPSATAPPATTCGYAVHEAVDNPVHAWITTVNLWIAKKFSIASPRTLAPRGGRGVELLPRRKRASPRGNSGNADGAGKPEPEAGGWPRRSARRSRRCQANRPAWIGRSSKAPSISYMEGALSYSARPTPPRPPTTRQQMVTVSARRSAVRSMPRQALERAARIGRHFERARRWGAVEDAEREHQAEKEAR